MTRRTLERKLGTDGIRRIENAVKAAEARTTAEIALFIREWTSPLARDPSVVRARAERLFVTHGLHRTAARNAVMLYVTLREHQAVVLGDSGIDARVQPDSWNHIVAVLTEAAKSGRLVDGVCAAVEACGALLAELYPARADDVDEIANAPNLDG